MMLKRALRPGGVSTGLIKGEASLEPGPGLVPGFSASGQDVWLNRATHFGPGLVLSAVGARCGKVFLADGDWSVVANTVVLTPQPGTSPKFLWYMVNNEDFWEKGGTAQPYVRVPETLARQVWLPALGEQRAIADYLDVETARIDALTAKKQQLIQLLKERRWRYFTDLVERAESRPVPLRRLIVSITDGPFGSSLKSSDYVDAAGARVVRLGNIKLGEFGDHDKAYISQDHFGTLLKHSVREGDLLIAGLGDTKNHVGRACVAPDLGEAIVKADCFCARTQDDLTSADFLAFYLSSPMGATSVAAYSRGTTRSRINLELTKEVVIDLPDLDRQAAIVSAAHEVRDCTRRLRRSIGGQLDLLGEKRQALITAAVTGEFTVPGAA